MPDPGMERENAPLLPRGGGGGDWALLELTDALQLERKVLFIRKTKANRTQLKEVVCPNFFKSDSSLAISYDLIIFNGTWHK